MNYYRIHIKDGCLEIASEMPLKSMAYHINNSYYSLIIFVLKDTGEEKFVKASEIYLLEQIFNYEKSK